MAEKPSKLVESRDTNITDKDAIMAGHPVEVGGVLVEKETVEMEAIVRKNSHIQPTKINLAFLL